MDEVTFRNRQRKLIHIYERIVNVRPVGEFSCRWAEGATKSQFDLGTTSKGRRRTTDFDTVAG